MSEDISIKYGDTFNKVYYCVFNNGIETLTAFDHFVSKMAELQDGKTPKTGYISEGYWYVQLPDNCIVSFSSRSVISKFLAEAGHPDYVISTPEEVLGTLKGVTVEAPEISIKFDEFDDLMDAYKGYTRLITRLDLFDGDGTVSLYSLLEAISRENLDSAVEKLGEDYLRQHGYKEADTYFDMFGISHVTGGVNAGYILTFPIPEKITKEEEVVWPTIEVFRNDAEPWFTYSPSAHPEIDTEPDKNGIVYGPFEIHYISGFEEEDGTEISSCTYGASFYAKVSYGEDK